MSTIPVNELIAAVLPHLGRIIQAAGDNVACRCPFPDHEDRSPSFSFNRRTGLWKCHGGCGRQGNAYQLATELGCIPARRQRGTTDHFARRQYRMDADRRLGTAMERYGISVGKFATEFPIRDHEGHEFRTHVRNHHGEPRFYFKPGERTYHAWCAWDLLKEWGAGCGIAYVVEGDRDAVTLAAHGYPGIGILGIEHFDHALKDIGAPLRMMGIGAMVLTPDNDEPGMKAVSEWAPKLEALGFAVGVRILPAKVNGVPIKDTSDAYAADRDGFEDLMHNIPIAWRGD